MIMKTDAEFLNEIARIYGIKVYYKKLTDGLAGEADAENKVVTICCTVLDNPRQHKCVLAEEIGHIIHPSRPGHIRYHSKHFHEREGCSAIKVIVAQDETRARDWATNVLLPNVELCHIKEVGASTMEELSSHFDVEPWFIEHKIGYLMRKSHEIGIMETGLVY